MGYFLSSNKLFILFSAPLFIAASSTTDNVLVDQHKQYTLLQKLGRWYFNNYCYYGGYIPQLSSIPLGWELVQKKVLALGVAPNCLELMLKANYKFPSRRSIKKLRESKLPIVWVVGGPGSGKGTLCSKYAKAESFSHISVGELSREEVKSPPTPSIARLMTDLMTEGALFPGSYAVTILARKMVSDLGNTKGFLIDGFPRAVDDSIIFQKKIRVPDAIIELDVRDEVLIERVLNRNQGRLDDNEETLQKRLRVYHQQTQPITSHGMFSSKVKKVNAEGSLEENYARFTAAIEESLKQV